MTTKTATKNSTNAAVSSKLAEPKLEPQNTANEKMSFEELGAAARAAMGRGAEWAWSLGRAMQIAKIKFDKDKAGYKAWKEEYLPELKIRTAQRYEALGILDYDAVRGKTIMDVYAVLWPEQAEKKAAKANKVKRMTAAKAVDYLLDDLEKNGATLIELHRDKLQALYAKLLTILKPR